jgi:hypothetical protein
MSCPAPHDIEDDLPTPEDVVVAAAHRLLELQARDAAGYPEPAIDYDGDTPPPGRSKLEVTVKVTGSQGGGAVPTIPSAVYELMAFRDLCAAFARAKEDTAELLPQPLLAGGVWWHVRMEARALGELAHHGVPVRELRRAMLEYEAAVLGHLADCA